MITKKEVQNIAKLARLGLAKKEIEKYQKEFSSILNYFGKLKQADISEVKEIYHFSGIENTVRKDEPAMEIKKEKERKEEKSKKLLKLAPETENSYLKIKSILEHGTN